MEVTGEPKIEDGFKDAISYTEVKFWPDLKKFGCTVFEEDMVALLEKRVYDVAGITPSKLNIHLNGKAISSVKNFEQYVRLYTGPKTGDDLFFKIDQPRWQVIVTASSGFFNQVSFVNGIATTRGGTHVEHIVSQVISKIKESAKQKKKVELIPA